MRRQRKQLALGGSASKLTREHRTAKRAFNPPITAQNDVLKVEVRKLHHKKRSLRVWMNLENKTISQPIEFLDLPRMQDVVITVTNVRVDGKGNAPDLTVTVPVRNPPEKTN